MVKCFRGMFILSFLISLYYIRKCKVYIFSFKNVLTPYLWPMISFLYILKDCPSLFPFNVCINLLTCHYQLYYS